MNTAASLGAGPSVPQSIFAPVPLGIFAKAPRPGRSKTRLSPLLGSEGAAQLYRAFLLDTLDFVRLCYRESPGKVTLLAADEEDIPVLEPLAAERGFSCIVQEGSNLGERMFHAWNCVVKPEQGAILVGTDAPTLPPWLLRRAQDVTRSLSASGYVLGPAVDGGFYLVGSKAAPEWLCGEVRWSSESTYEDTVRSAARAKLHGHSLRPWYDVDSPEDLRLLQLHLSVDKQTARHTRGALNDLGLHWSESQDGAQNTRLSRR